MPGVKKVVSVAEETFEERCVWFEMEVGTLKRMAAPAAGGSARLQSR